MSHRRDIDDLLEDAEHLAINEEGEIVPLSEHIEGASGKGVRLKEHTMY